MISFARLSADDLYLGILGEGRCIQKSKHIAMPGCSPVVCSRMLVLPVVAMRHCVHWSGATSTFDDEVVPRN